MIALALTNNWQNLSSELYWPIVGLILGATSLRPAKKYKELESWANAWLDRIAIIYHLNKVCLECIDDPIQFKQAQTDLEKAIKELKEKIDEEAADESLHPYQKKVLKSAVGHWEGLTVFVKYPEVPIDNNEALC